MFHCSVIASQVYYSGLIEVCMNGWHEYRYEEKDFDTDYSGRKGVNFLIPILMGL